MRGICDCGPQKLSMKYFFKILPPPPLTKYWYHHPSAHQAGKQEVDGFGGGRVKSQHALSQK